MHASSVHGAQTSSWTDLTSATIRSSWNPCVEHHTSVYTLPVYAWTTGPDELASLGPQHKSPQNLTQHQQNRLLGLAAQRLDLQYNRKQTTNHKTYTGMPTKLQSYWSLGSPKNKEFLSLFVLASNWRSFAERQRRLVIVSSRFASNRWWRQWPLLFIIWIIFCIASHVYQQASLTVVVQFSVYSPPPVMIWQAHHWTASRVFVWSAVRLVCQTGLAYSNTGLTTAS